MRKHAHFPYTRIYSSTSHNSGGKHNIRYIPYTNTQYTLPLQGKNGRYTITIPTYTHTVTTTYIKVIRCHIHIAIASRHLPCTPPENISSSEATLPRLTCRTLVYLRTSKLPFLLYTVDANSHQSPLFPLCNTTPPPPTHIRTTV